MNLYIGQNFSKLSRDECRLIWCKHTTTSSSQQQEQNDPLSSFLHINVMGSIENLPGKWCFMPPNIKYKKCVSINMICRTDTRVWFPWCSEQTSRSPTISFRCRSFLQNHQAKSVSKDRFWPPKGNVPREIESSRRWSSDWPEVGDSYKGALRPISAPDLAKTTASVLFQWLLIATNLW